MVGKMKKRLLVILFFMILLFAGCKDTNKYALEVDDPGHYIVKKLEKEYQAGETITIKIPVIENIGLYLFLDNESSYSPIIVEENNGDNYWQFSFIMPTHNAKISLRANEIKSLINTAPADQQIIYFDNEISEIIYNIKFDYEETNKTFDLHEKFVAESGLNDLDNRGLFYFKNSPYVFLFLSPCQDTIEVQAFLNNLKNDYSSIIEIEKEVLYRYSTIYMHNPLFYGLEDSDKIIYEMTSPTILPAGIYTNVDEVEVGINDYFDANKDRIYIIDREEEIREATKLKYNEQYFQDNILAYRPVKVLFPFAWHARRKAWRWH